MKKLVPAMRAIQVAPGKMVLCVLGADRQFRTEAGEEVTPYAPQGAGSRTWLQQRKNNKMAFSDLANSRSATISF